MMEVPSVSIIVGVLLMATGLSGYIYIERTSWTALIPLILGAAMLVLGLLARRENLRKHAMHLALVFALIGLIGSGVRAGLGFSRQLGGAHSDYPAAPYFNVAVVVLCAIFLALGIRSFIDARRRRLLKPGG